MKRLPYVLLSLALGACTTASSPPAGEVDPLTVTPTAPESKDPRPRGAWAHRPRTHAVLVSHSRAEATGFVQMVSLAEGGALGARHAWSGAADPSGNSFSFVAGHGGGDHVAIVTPAALGFELAWAEDGNPSGASRVPIGDTFPAALSVHGSTVMLGIGTTLVEVAFDDDDPSPRVVHNRDGLGNKAYDVFTSAGDWMVAVDDMALPYYADSLRLGGAGRARHEAGFALPSLINGTYQFAQLHRTADFEGSLYVVTQFGVISGHGHQLARLPMKDGVTTLEVDTPLNSGAAGVAVEEFMARPSGAVSVVDGDTMTAWSGLALVEEGGAVMAVLVAAGARGVLQFPAEVGPGAQPQAIDLGSPCLDVIAQGDRVWVLTDGAVVGMRWAGEALVEESRVPLSDPATRWAR